jgi:hypothetical protein
MVSPPRLRAAVLSRRRNAKRPSSAVPLVGHRPPAALAALPPRRSPPGAKGIPPRSLHPEHESAVRPYHQFPSRSTSCTDAIPDIYLTTLAIASPRLRISGLLPQGGLCPQPNRLDLEATVGLNGFIIAAGHVYCIVGPFQGPEKKGFNYKHTGDAIIYCQVVPVGKDAFGTPVQLPVETVSNPAKDPAVAKKIIALTAGCYQQTSDYGWHNYGSAPFAGGNRLFIRTYDYLWPTKDCSSAWTGRSRANW